MINDKKKSLMAPICKTCGKILTDEENINKELIISDDAVEHIANILTADGHNNAVIIGKAGTGKTALVQGLAKSIVEGKYNGLNGRVIAEISLDQLSKNCPTAAELGDKVERFFQEVSRENIIVFIDEGHRLCGYGPNSLGNIMKPILTRDDIQVITATTEEEYNEYMASDRALVRRFEKVTVKEPSVTQTKDILKHILRVKYDGIIIDDKNIIMIIDYAEKYMHERYNPDKSIALLDYIIASAKNKIDGETITLDTILYAVSLYTGIPEATLKKDIENSVAQLSSELAQKFPGWEKELTKLSSIIEDSIFDNKLNDRENCPICSILLTGQDTEFLKAIATETAISMGFLKDKGIKTMSIIDPNTFSYDIDSTSIIKTMRNNPYTAFILTNAEQISINDNIYNYLNTPTQKVSEAIRNGVLSDNKGESINFKNAVFFITAKVKEGKNYIGFEKQNSFNETKNIPFALNSIKKTLFTENKFQFVFFGAPDKDKIDDVFENIFIPMLEQKSQLISFNGKIFFEETAKQKITEMLSNEMAWSNIGIIIKGILKNIPMTGTSFAVGYKNDNWIIEEPSYLEK